MTIVTILPIGNNYNLLFIIRRSVSVNNNIVIKQLTSLLPITVNSCYPQLSFCQQHMKYLKYTVACLIHIDHVRNSQRENIIYDRRQRFLAAMFSFGPENNTNT